MNKLANFKPYFPDDVVCGAISADNSLALCQLEPFHEGWHNWSLYFWRDDNRPIGDQWHVLPPEEIGAILKQVTFDSSAIKLHKDKK
jgi:hypothetical protein